MHMPFFLGCAVSALRGAGGDASGREWIDEALALIARTDARWYEAEAMRVDAGLRPAAVSRAEDRRAEDRLLSALGVARAQQARWWELRIARDLARLWRDRGRASEARALLAPVYAAFTEGFALPDLVEAKTLLEELGAAPANGAGRRQGEVRMPQGPDCFREPAPGR